MTGYRPLEDGERRELTVTFVSRRVLDCDGALVRRLLVEDERGDRFALFVAPDAERRVDLRTGDRYRIRGVLGCTPPEGATDEPCPRCGAALRRGCAVDTVHAAVATVVDRLELDGTFGVFDATTHVASVDGVGADDWRPVRPNRGTATPPDRVCVDCGRRADEHDGTGGRD